MQPARAPWSLFLPGVLSLALGLGCRPPPPMEPAEDLAGTEADLAAPPADLLLADLSGVADLRDPDMDGPPTGDMATGRLPIHDLDQLALIINLGDSVGAGYNAQGRNGAGGRGFARLLVNNHADFPKYNGHDLATKYPGVAFRDLAESGATSDDMLSRLRSALGGGLPAAVAGDVLVTINVGGNDFNDKVDVILDPVKTRVVAMKVRANLAQAVTLLRQRYEVPAAGKAVVFLIDNIYDPTDGKGEIPAVYMSGFCRSIHLLGIFKMQALANLATLNQEIAAEVMAQRGYLVDIHVGFIGHGMNGGAGRWIDTDCVHPINPGHDLIRRLAWQALTGETY